jgi:hypothetical protein
MFSYVISLLANLNARGQLSSEVHMSDVPTPQITVGSSAQQQANEGDGPPPLFQASSAVAPGTSVINTVSQGAPTAEEAQNVTTESVVFATQQDIMEISAHVWGWVLNHINTHLLQICLLPYKYLFDWNCAFFLEIQIFLFCMFQTVVLYLCFVVKQKTHHYHCSWSEMNHWMADFILI